MPSTENSTLTHDSCSDPVNVICIQWGTEYGVEYVNRLYSMITRNTTRNIKFHVFSDEALDGLEEGILHLPEPGIRIPSRYKNYNYRRRRLLRQPAGRTGRATCFLVRSRRTHHEQPR